MNKITLERIRDSLASALVHSREADFSTLTYLLKMTLAEVSELATKMGASGAPTPISENRPPDVIGSWDWDIVNKVVYADPGVAMIYNVTAEAGEQGVPQDEFGTAIYVEDMPKVSAAVSHTLSEGGGFTVVYRLVQADGSLKAVLAIGRAVFKNGSPTNFKGTIIDVTDDDVRRERGMKYKTPEPSSRRSHG